MASQWFRDNVLFQSNFMTAQDFQADIRRFLLSLNKTRGEDQLVGVLPGAALLPGAPLLPPSLP